jgi:hypothetical protein
MAKYESKGPSFARFLQHEMMDDAEFCMQIDSHTYFVNNWDKEVLTMWGATKNEYAVISTQLPGIMYRCIFVSYIIGV